MQTTANTRPGMTTRTLLPFLGLTFGVTWGIAALLILFNEAIVATLGDPGATALFILAVYAPGLAGVFLVWRTYGVRGLAGFFRRLTLWRASRWWWLFFALGIPVLFYFGAALKGGAIDPFPFSPWYLVFGAMLQLLFLGTIEEFGWRGVALPLLQRRFAPIWAGLIVGVAWAVWHIPAFLLSGTVQSGWSFLPFFAGVVAISVILTPLFNNSGGSLLIAYLFHFQMMNPLWPDAQPWDNLLFVLAAIVVVWLNRRTMFRRGAGVTEVLLPLRGAEGTLDRSKGDVDRRGGAVLS